MKYSLFFLVLASFLFWGCPRGTNDPDATGTIELNFQPYWNGTALEFGAPLTTALGKTITLDSFQYYVSNIRAIKEDNSEVLITGIALYDLLESGKTYHGGGVSHGFETKVGDYKGLKFDIGVSQTMNHTDATSYSSDSPLHISKNMFWNEIDGYTFLFLKAQTDSTGIPFPVSYRVGLDDLRTTLDFSLQEKDAFTIKKNKETQFIIQIDLREIIGNIDITRNPITSSRPKNSPEYLLSQHIMDNLKTKSLFKEP